MKWFGFPVEVIVSDIDGEQVEVGIVYQWANGDRRIRWYEGDEPEDQANLQYLPLSESA